MKTFRISINTGNAPEGTALLFALTELIKDTPELVDYAAGDLYERTIRVGGRVVRVYAERGK